MIRSMYLTYAGNNRIAIKAPKYKTNRYGDPVMPLEVLEPGLLVDGLHDAITKQLQTTEDTFLWTYSTQQEATWKTLVEKNGWQKYIVFESPYVTNPNYGTRRVAMVIMKGKPENAS
jgi:hypothetical protein